MTARGTITLIDYGIGNIGSVANMIRHCGGESLASGDPEVIRNASVLLLPGIGHFDAGMAALNAAGISDAIRSAVTEGGATLLGICLGMQLLLEGSEEGDLPGLALVPGYARRLRGEGVRVPHMGWTPVRATRESALFSPGEEEQRFYFVHSFHAACADPGDVAATSDYGERFTSAFERGRTMGVQFHPEKSHRFGMGLFRRFLGT